MERDEARYVEPRVLGRLLPHLSERFKEAFPEGDPYELLIPSTTLGGWIRNQRLRRGMSQKDLARAVRVHQFTVIRYEKNSTQPDPDVRQRLEAVLGSGFERFLNRATISAGARSRPAPEAGSPGSSGRHEAKKQAVAAVHVRSRRS